MKLRDHKKRILVTAVIAGCLLVVIGWWNTRSKLSERMKDVQKLAGVYIQAEQVTNIQDLIRSLENSGLHLSSPIPKNPSLACYRLVVPKTSGSPNQVFHPNEIVIEETNTTDNRRIVVAVGDGSVFVTRPSR